jgi:hypothetical protein
LTAAHCIYNTNPELAVAVVGSVSLSEGGQIYDLERVIAHSGFPAQWKPWFQNSWNE